jgi:hypothetical protein
MTDLNYQKNNLINHWDHNKDTYLKICVFLMTIVSVVSISHHFLNFYLGTSPIWKFTQSGAGDLLLRNNEIKMWFSGLPVYDNMRDAAYPPASYAILWPLLNFDNIIIIKLIWIFIYLVSIVVLSFIFVKYSNVDTKLEKAFVALIPLTTYSLGASVGIGQITLLVILPLLISILKLKDQIDSIKNQLIISILFLFSLVKPSISAPFFWLVIFLPKNLRPAFVIIIGYILLTFIASYFQSDNTYILINKWLNNSSDSLIDFGHSQFYDLHYFLIMIGKENWRFPVSLIAIGLAGYWIYKNKHADIWIIIGVTALVSRFWTYHNWYDDVLLILPTIPLLRSIKDKNLSFHTKIYAFALFILLCLSNIAPGGLFMLSEPIRTVYICFQLIVWLSVMVFLIILARHVKSSERKQGQALVVEL